LFRLVVFRKLLLIFVFARVGCSLDEPIRVVCFLPPGHHWQSIFEGNFGIWPVNRYARWQEWTQRNQLLSLFDELKRRKVFRVVIAYAIAAWLFAQVAALVADAFDAPAWVMQVILALLVLGLPLSVVLSWAFDLTRDGVIRAQDADTNQPASRKRARRGRDRIRAGAEPSGSPPGYG